MRKTVALICLISIAFIVPVLGGEGGRAAKKRAKIDKVVDEALSAVLEKSEGARALYDQAYGWAGFDNTKVSLGITGAGGVGVAVVKGSGERTYMNMGSGGLNVGLGVQLYQVIFLFQTQEVFDNFVEKGWQADAGATASAGRAGANAAASFRNGMAVYQITDAGLMLQADISGTKYWKSKKLND